MDVHFFKEVPDYPGYFCSDFGLIRSKKKGIYTDLTQGISKAGYATVNMSRDGVSSGWLVHRIVAITWIPNPDSKKTVNHKNGKKRDNRVANLEWFTPKEQAVHAHETGLIKKHTRPVCQSDFKGKLIAEYKSIKEASKAIGTDDRKRIGDVCAANAKGKTTRSTGGFVWHYKENFKGQKLLRPRCKVVCQYTTLGKLVKKYHGCQEAADAVGTKRKRITNACYKNGGEACGYIWRYDDKNPTRKKEKFVLPEKYKTWVMIKDAPGYRISRTGEVYSDKTKKILKPNVSTGRPILGLQVNGKRIGFQINRLVALAYIPNPNNHPIVNHIDGKPLNNSVENLEWCTKQHDVQHSYNTGLNKGRAVIQLSMEDKEVARYKSIKEAERLSPSGHSSIQRVLSGEIKSTKGYKWKYAD